jgi:hypothetical protein
MLNHTSMRTLLLTAALAACAHRPEYRGNVTVKSAELIKVDPDVRVVADADQPMFHIVGTYWLFHDTSWYRGASVRGPWVLEPHPPWQVRKIDQPYAFARYRLDHPTERTADRNVETPSKDLGQQSRMFSF